MPPRLASGPQECGAPFEVGATPKWTYLSYANKLGQTKLSIADVLLHGVVRLPAKGYAPGPRRRQAVGVHYKQLRRQAHKVSVTPAVFQPPVSRPSFIRFDHIAQ